MSTLTTRLGLLKPAGSDPFQRTDFITTWDTLDDSPGTFVCTSGSRPSWGIDQDGRLIFEQDTSRIVQWDGTDWLQVRQAANGYQFHVAYDDNLPASSSGFKAIGSVATTTPGSLMWLLTANVTCPEGDVQNITTGFQIDGVDVHDGAGGFNRWAIPNANITGTPDEWTNDVSVSGMTTIASGTHVVRMSYEVGNGSQHLVLRNLRLLAWMVQGTGSH